MKKEIEILTNEPYRGRSLQTGELIYGYHYEMNKESYILIPCGRFSETEFYEVCPGSVGRAAGLSDQKGIWLYSKDIIKVTYPGVLGINREAVGILQDENPFWMVDFPHLGVTVPLDRFYNDEPGDFQKIGNEMDDPDILNALTKNS